MLDILPRLTGLITPSKDVPGTLRTKLYGFATYSEVVINQLENQHLFSLIRNKNLPK